MRRILFVDDCPRRRNWFGWHGVKFEDQLWFAENVEEAIHALGNIVGYDLVHLDHDLGDEVYVSSDRKDCGMEIVRWIIANRPKIGLIIVHTMNTPAGHAMVRSLKHAGYQARYKSFYQMVRDNIHDHPLPPDLN